MITTRIHYYDRKKLACYLKLFSSSFFYPNVKYSLSKKKWQITESQQLI